MISHNNDSTLWFPDQLISCIAFILARVGWDFTIWLCRGWTDMVWTKTADGSHINWHPWFAQTRSSRTTGHIQRWPVLGLSLSCHFNSFESRNLLKWQRPTDALVDVKCNCSAHWSPTGNSASRNSNRRYTQWHRPTAYVTHFAVPYTDVLTVVTHNGSALHNSWWTLHTMAAPTSR